MNFKYLLMMSLFIIISPTVLLSMKIAILLNPGPIGQQDKLVAVRALLSLDPKAQPPESDSDFQPDSSDSSQNITVPGRVIGEKFSKPKTTQEKAKRSNTNNNQFPCEKCHRIYNRRENLRRHVREKHEEELCNRFGCKQCSQKFVYPNQLKSHVLIKHGHALLKCLQCPKTVKYINSLNAHIRSKHNNETYECNDCKKTWTYIDSVRRHIRKTRHSGYAIR